MVVFCLTYNKCYQWDYVMVFPPSFLNDRLSVRFVFWYHRDLEKKYPKIACPNNIPLFMRCFPVISGKSFICRGNLHTPFFPARGEVLVTAF